MSADVVIPNWNGAALLSRCLQALDRQTLAPARILVVDNGSSDGSQSVVGAHARAEWLPLGRNAGFAAAANAGIRASTADYVALLNNDAEADERWLAALAAALDADQDVSFCASRLLFSNGRGVNAAGDAFDVRGRGGYNRGLGERDGPRFDEPRLVFGACAAAALYRRSLFADVGLFDEAFFLSWEDVELDLRAALAGHRCLYVPAAVAWHEQGASSGAGRAALERRNKAWLALKDLPPPLLAAFCALVPLRELYEARAAGEGPGGWLARVAPFVREAPRAWRWRGEPRRRARYRDLLPLLLFESLPYDGPAADGARGKAVLEHA